MRQQARTPHRRLWPLLAAALLATAMAAGLGPAAAEQAPADRKSDREAGQESDREAVEQAAAAGQFRNPVNTGADPAMVTREGNGGCS